MLCALALLADAARPGPVGHLAVDAGGEVGLPGPLVTLATLTHPADRLPVDVMLPYQVAQLGGRAALRVHVVRNRPLSSSHSKKQTEALSPVSNADHG